MADWFSRLTGGSSSEPSQPSPEDEDDTLTNPPLEQQLLGLEQASVEALALLAEKVEGVEKIVSRLAKEQFKANSLTEDALAAVKSTLLPPVGSPVERASQMKPPAPNSRLLEALMPILDGIEAGLVSGQTQASLIGDQRARDTLMGWLEGQRLLRDRLLALLDKENVRPIESVGQLFDPYHHVAVDTVFDPSQPTGTIVEERRRGYETDQRVLRFAEVVVTSQRQP